MIRRFSKKFYHLFSHVFILITRFLRVMVLLLCRSRVVSKINILIYPYPISEVIGNCSSLWHTATKPWLSWNILPNIKTYENGWANFSENLRIMAIKLLELKLNSQHQIYQFTYILYSFGVLCDIDIFKWTILYFAVWVMNKIHQFIFVELYIEKKCSN